MATYETRAVLAATYVKLDDDTVCLTHTAIVNGDGYETAVLCKRVKLASLCDAGGSDTAAAPTCQTCLKRDPRFNVAR